MGHRGEGKRENEEAVRQDKWVACNITYQGRTVSILFWILLNLHLFNGVFFVLFLVFVFWLTLIEFEEAQ